MVRSIQAILIKEQRQGLRANLFIIPFIAVQLLAVVCVVLEYQSKQEIFWHFAGAIFFVAMPLTNFLSLDSEISGNRNIELLFAAGLTRWQIILGKWMTANIFALLLLSSLLPYWVSRYFYGVISEVLFEIGFLGVLVLSNWVMNAIVIGASANKNHLKKLMVIAILGGLSWVIIIGNLIISVEFYLSWLPDLIAVIVSSIFGASLSIVASLQVARTTVGALFHPESSIEPGLVNFIFLSAALAPCLGPIWIVVGIYLVIKDYRTRVP